jgi:hypothetical protein
MGLADYPAISGLLIDVTDVMRLPGNKSTGPNVRACMTTRCRTLPLILTTAVALTVGLAACGSDTPSNSDTGMPPTPTPVDTTPPDPPSTPVTEPLDDPTEPTPLPVTETATAVDVEIDDGTFASIAEMVAASTLVAVGEVVDTTSIERPDVAIDAAADEYVAITVRPTETLVGDTVDEIVIAWHAYAVDADGSRTAIRMMNGLRRPNVGDHLLLFLDPADPAFVEHLGGAPTHQLVKLDGLVQLDGGRVVGGEANSPVVEQMLGMTIGDLRADFMQ